MYPLHEEGGEIKSQEQKASIMSNKSESTWVGIDFISLTLVGLLTLASLI